MLLEFLTRTFTKTLKTERMPEEQRRRVLVPIFKYKGDVQSYGGIKLLRHDEVMGKRSRS